MVEVMFNYHGGKNIYNISKILHYGAFFLILISPPAFATNDKALSTQFSSADSFIDLNLTVGKHIAINGFVDGFFTSNFNTETVDTSLCVWTNASDNSSWTGFYTSITAASGSPTTPVLVGTDGSVINLNMTLNTFTPGDKATPTQSYQNITLDHAYAVSNDINFNARYRAGKSGPKCKATKQTMSILSELTAIQKATSKAAVLYSNTFTVIVQLA